MKSLKVVAESETKNEILDKTLTSIYKVKTFDFFSTYNTQHTTLEIALS